MPNIVSIEIRNKKQKYDNEIKKKNYNICTMYLGTTWKILREQNNNNVVVGYNLQDEFRPIGNLKTLMFYTLVISKNEL